MQYRKRFVVFFHTTYHIRRTAYFTQLTTFTISLFVWYAVSFSSFPITQELQSLGFTPDSVRSGVQELQREALSILAYLAHNSAGLRDHSLTEAVEGYRARLSAIKLSIPDPVQANYPYRWIYVCKQHAPSMMERLEYLHKHRGRFHYLMIRCIYGLLEKYQQNVLWQRPEEVTKAIADRIFSEIPELPAWNTHCNCLLHESKLRGGVTWPNAISNVFASKNPQKI